MKTVNKGLSLFFATLGVGLLPFCPGTYASVLIAIFIYWLSPGVLTWFILLIVFTIIAFLSIPRASIALGEKAKDHPEITIDEAIGMLFALFPVVLYGEWSLEIVIFALICFRMLDILKPWPICYADRIKSWYGVVGDDLIAGILVAILLFMGLNA